MVSFPEFKKLELSDKALFYDFTKQFLPYSDFNFSSLWSYADENTSFSLLNNNLVITLPDYITNNSIYSFLGNEKIESTFYELFEFLKQNNHPTELHMVPEICITHNEQYLRSRYEIIEDRDNYDYILSTKQMADLDGSIFHDQRNAVSHFLREVPDHSFVTLNLDELAIQKEIIDLCYVWGTRKKKTEEEIEREILAVKKVLENAHVLNIFGVGIYINSQIVGFFISEIINDKYAIGHFRKVDTTYHGIFTYIDHKMAEVLFQKGIEYFNFEQDMGITSLRKAKESWNPVFFLKKYKVLKK